MSLVERPVNPREGVGSRPGCERLLKCWLFLFTHFVMPAFRKLQEAWGVDPNILTL